MRFSKDVLLEMYDDIVEARVLSEKIIEYIYSGKIAGAIHPPLGQEGVNAGILTAFKNCGLKTYSTPTHRQQTIMGYRLGFKPFIAELLGKQGGPNGGIAGEYHLIKISKGHVPGMGALGSTWGELAGVAWALKHDGVKDTVCFGALGDGAISIGATYEAMNIAMLYKLPIVFFIENNGVAMSTPVEKQSPLTNLADRAEAFNMKHITVDGKDVVAVAEAILDAIQYAHENNEPFMVEAKDMVRWEGHYVGDNQAVYRDVSFRKNTDPIDPVLIFQKRLMEMGYIDDAYVQSVREKKIAKVEEAFTEAIAQSTPTREQVLDVNRLFADPEGSEM